MRRLQDWPELKIAAEVVDKLQDWIEERENLSATPITVLTVSTYSMEITIGGVCVWCQREDALEDLTFEYCRDAYLEELGYLAPFWNEVTAHYAAEAEKL